MTKLNAIPLSRRGFLITGGATGLVCGFLTPALAAWDPMGAVTPTAPSFDPTLWYSIDATGMVTVNIIRAEMGQHVGTAIARILADELEVDWAQVRITHVDTDPKWGLMVTGGSWSVWQSFPVYAQAGAAGRIALIEAGAAMMGVASADCTARAGVVSGGDRSVSYAEIVAKGVTRSFNADELAAMPIKPVSERRLIGKPVTALDVAGKIDGSVIYGIDAKVEGMVYARPLLPPTRNGSVALSVDDAAAKGVKGYLSSLILDDPSGTVPGWVMVMAESYPAAIKASNLVKVTWAPGPTAAVDEAQIQDRARALIADPAAGALLDTGGGDTDAAFAAAASRIEATYTTATVLHFQLEPVNALAVEVDGVMEVHTGNQWQSLILPQLAMALGRDESTVLMRTYPMGGGFGRRLNGDYAIPAALAAQALGRPVKMILTRADDARFDSVRSPSVQTLRMAFDAAGAVTGMEHHAAAGWPTQVMAAFFMPKGTNGEPYDPFAISGADHWYEVGAQKVRALSNDLANATFRPGWLRSVGPGWTNWALESFMDTAAAHVGADPLAFRLGLLTGAGRNAGVTVNDKGGALRQANVLRLVAERAGWGTPLPAGSARGIATSFGQERGMPTWVACVAEVTVDPATGIVTVQKLTIVTDAGTIIDPDSARAQTEGAMLWGLSMALYEGTEFAAGQVRDTNLNTYTPLRIGDVPLLDISFVDSAEVPVGLGEPATTVVAPAIGNAIFAATGGRVTHIPITPQAVLAAAAAPGAP
ncbi:molybdopterin-dependent oxidoreductase [Rhodobacter sp. Har01]|uniref:xanthine dehydrogenase family protein molybdopterin-binding subunit n=1 Tax=Rhodobacter sp. Har01 TaxID=2883999 RepID=UPI001D07E300|nr:molybdopterin cofactor-binding domain-containing protein [Rhodobacter sp. Har01]MCB6180144.1 molybdopterin-dependent oxidoreductase [Rhodobacter sp. Har01]